MILKRILAMAAFAFVRSLASDRVTVPLIVEGNRPFVDLSFEKPDGTVRKARFWVDTGGGSFWLMQKLALDLGLRAQGEPIVAEDAKFWPIQPPRAWIGDFELDLTGCHSVITDPRPGLPIEGMLPGSVLKNHDVVFDYPKNTFTIARPGILKPEGRRLAASIAAENGFPRVELEMDGEKLGFLLDTGASFTMVSQTRFDSWMKRHDTWPCAEGAFGHANMLQGGDAKNWIGRLQGARLGDIRLGWVDVVTRNPGVYEDWMSKETAPIVGALGGNILRQFRVEIDYSASAVYLKRGHAIGLKEFNAIPWTVGRERGAWAIMAGPDSLGAKPGDQIVSIDNRAVRDLSLARMQDALLGRAGDQKRVTLRRGKQDIFVTTVVNDGIRGRRRH